MPKLFHSLAPDASFTQDDFSPLLTELHQVPGGEVIVVWDQSVYSALGESNGG